MMLKREKIVTVYYDPTDLTQVFGENGEPLDAGAFGLMFVDAAIARGIDWNSESFKEAIRRKTRMIRKAREAMKRMVLDPSQYDTSGPYIKIVEPK